MSGHVLVHVGWAIYVELLGFNQSSNRFIAGSLECEYDQSRDGYCNDQLHNSPGRFLV